MHRAGGDERPSRAGLGAQPRHRVGVRRHEGGGGEAVDVEQDEDVGAALRRGAGEGVAGAGERQAAVVDVDLEHLGDDAGQAGAPRGPGGLLRDDGRHLGVAHGGDEDEVGGPVLPGEAGEQPAQVVVPAVDRDEDGEGHEATRAWVVSSVVSSGVSSPTASGRHVPSATASTTAA